MKKERFKLIFPLLSKESDVIAKYPPLLVLLSVFWVAYANAEIVKPDTVEKTQLQAFMDTIENMPSELQFQALFDNRDNMPHELLEGRQYDLCTNFADLMRRMLFNPRGSCELRHTFDDIAKQQGFREIAWVEVDIQEHKEMLRMYFYYHAENWKRPFSQENFEKNMDYPPRLWRKTMDLNFDGIQEVVYRLAGVFRHNKSDDPCSFTPSTYFIYDEKKPYSQFSRKRKTTLSIDGYLFYYKGRPYNFWVEVLSKWGTK